MARDASITYQPALDGVRALAVIAVLAFHAQVPGTSGGYLGVSVFFTLSGYLITSLLIAEQRSTDGIRIGAFYLRRIRRLLPASVVCVAAVIAIAALTDWFGPVSDLRRDALGSLFQVANWVFLFGGGSYQELFDQATGVVSPLEHYWSLAIEEQFYWLWPVAFLGLTRLAPGLNRRAVVLGVITIGFAACAPITAWVWGGDAAYWATPARAAEILIGAVLALVLAERSVPARLAPAAPIALMILLVTVVTFPASGGPAFNGALPLIGVVSAALLVGLQVPGPARSALGVRPLVWLGRISYGVYLYHWPIYLIVDADRLGVDGAPLVFVRVALTVVVAQLSYTFIEYPIRIGKRLRPQATLLTAVGSTIAVAAFAVVVAPTSTGSYWEQDPELAAAVTIEQVDAEDLVPLGDAIADQSDAATPTTTVSPVTTTSVAAPEEPDEPEEPNDPTDPDPAAPVEPEPLARPVRMLIAGDSTAEAIGAGLIAWAADAPERAQVEVASVPGCGIVTGGERLVGDTWQQVSTGCDAWAHQGLAERAATLAPDVVMITTTSWDVVDRRWEDGVALSPQDPAYRDRIRADFETTTQAVLDAGVGVVAWIIHPIPDLEESGPAEVQTDASRHAVLFEVMAELARELGPRVAVIDLAGWVDRVGLDHEPGARPDGVHWTTEASARIAQQYLGERLVRAAIRAL